MKITKFVHSCLLVEMPAPVNRTVLFDPGVMSAGAIDVDTLKYLDDIVITHTHPDHFDKGLIQKLVSKFPDVRITTTEEGVDQLKQQGVTASANPAEGMAFFDSPHEDVTPLFPQPLQIGVHYLGKLSDPGDSHSFHETKDVLALPVTAPWGTNVNAVKLGLKLKPKYILPIHDWHWSDDARKASYEAMEQKFGNEGITFIKLETGVPVVLDV